MLATVSETYRVDLAEAVVFPKRLRRPDEFAHLVLMLAEHGYIYGRHCANGRRARCGTSVTVGAAKEIDAASSMHASDSDNQECRGIGSSRRF